MASPELLQLVENCPTGAETLIARILNIITDKGKVFFYMSDILQLQTYRQLPLVSPALLPLRKGF